MKHLLRATLIVAGLASLLALASPALGTGAAAAPVIKLKDDRFGNILARRDHKALYYWNVEKRDFKIHCTGSCARAWPPLIVRSASAVPRKLPNVKGVFGVIRRPDGRLQVTHNRLPLYTYADEAPDQVLCDDVDGWFVVRV